MAYLVGRSSGALDATAVSTSFSLPLPDHQTDDLLLICVSQDVGSGTLSCTGWTGIGTQANSNGVRHYWFYKVATSSSESAPVVESTISDEWAGTLLVIRDVDTATPIHANGKTDAAIPITTPSVTTTADDCLLLYSCGLDSASNWPVLFCDIVIQVDAQLSALTTQHLVGYHQQIAAGAAPSQVYHGVVADGGTSWIIAVKNKTGGSIMPSLRDAGQTIGRFSGVVSDTNLTTSAVSAVAASINGRTVNSAAVISGSNTAYTSAPGGYYEQYGWNVSVADEWVGVLWTIASTNMTGKIVSIAWVRPTSGQQGSDGHYVIFVDSSGNWVAYTLAKLSEIANEATVNSNIAVGYGTELDSAGTMDWSAVVGFGIGYHRIGSSTNIRYFGIKRAMLIDKVIVAGGSQAYPVSPGLTGRIYEGLPGMIDRQGANQAFSRLPFQIGNGTDKTYYAAIGSSYELPGTYKPTSGQLLWNVPASRVGITVYASPDDVIDFSSGVMVSASRQPFTIHASSSSSATYSFAGSILSGFDVTGQVGITFDGANFVKCYDVLPNGATLDGCTIRGSLSDVAVTTADPSEIIDCQFVSGGSGHAIELTTPGTYAFSGNTFTGYGSAGTADAAIYNNSGGAITLNISGGGDTPTVRNSAGSSTTVSNAVTIVFVGVNAGSEIRVYNLSGTELAGVESCDADHALSFTSGVGESATFRIVHPQYKIKEFNAVVPTTSGSLPVQQELDRWYSNPI
jgi:hypothetical protein